MNEQEIINEETLVHTTKIGSSKITFKPIGPNGLHGTSIEIEDKDGNISKSIALGF